jgi:catechol 2,3-dioxygenase-like lactoylglutathione lyase family enzyme
VLTKLEHVGLSVADLDRSLAFYRDLLGLDVLRVLECGSDSDLGRVVGMPRCRARIAHLLLGDSMLELFEYAVPTGRPLAADCRQADHGWVHAGMTSTDVRADYTRLRAAGVTFLSEPVQFRPGVWIVYLRGPDGEILELRQTPEGDSDRPMPGPEQTQGEAT